LAQKIVKKMIISVSFILYNSKNTTIALHT